MQYEISIQYTYVHGMRCMVMLSYILNTTNKVHITVAISKSH